MDTEDRPGPAPAPALCTCGAFLPSCVKKALQTQPQETWKPVPSDPDLLTPLEVLRRSCVNSAPGAGGQTHLVPIFPSIIHISCVFSLMNTFKTSRCFKFLSCSLAYTRKFKQTSALIETQGMQGQALSLGGRGALCGPLDTPALAALPHLATRSRAEPCAPAVLSAWEQAQNGCP